MQILYSRGFSPLHYRGHYLVLLVSSLLCLFTIGEFLLHQRETDSDRLSNYHAMPRTVLSSLNGDVPEHSNVGNLRELEEKSNNHVFEGERRPLQGLKDALFRHLKGGLIEFRGVLPVPLEERTSTQYSTFVSNRCSFLPTAYPFLEIQYM